MMDSFEFTKISAGVLMALLVIFLPKTLIELSRAGHGGHEVAGGYKLPEPKAEADAGAAAGKEEAKFDAKAVVALISKAKPENAAGTFKKCAACHSADATSASKAGPNLWNIVNRAKASRSDFAGYSDAIKAKSSEKWTYENLAGFLHSPKTYMPGTKMNFGGVPEAADLADLLAYLRTLADSPAALP